GAVALEATVEIAAVLVLLEEGLECVEERHAALVEHGYSMTWSARRSNVCGIVSPSALAVLRLMTSANLVGCSTGRSAGLAPLRILSTKVAARRQRSGKVTPNAIRPLSRACAQACTPGG